LKDKTFERKTELLEAALAEFAENSYENASLNRIIKNAGISKGTFYYHFADKQALYLFLLEVSAKAKWDFINNRVPGTSGIDERTSIFDMFRLQARLGAEFAAAYPLYHQLSRMLSREQGSEIHETAKQYLGGDTKEMLGNMIDTAIDNGDFKSGFSRAFIVKVLSFLFIGFDEIFNTEEDSGIDRMLSNLDSYIDFIRYGIGS
jgi:AcrR family transcriptional regulator